MRYFTPQRFARLQGPSQAMAAAIQDWERAAEEYSAHLQQIDSELTRELRRFVGSGSLHDARLVVMWPEPRRRLRILLQKEAQTNFVDLRYTLLDPPQINAESLPGACRSADLMWLYDEIDVEKTANDPAGSPTFTHDILFSNGWEMHLRFTRLIVHRPSVLLPAAPGPLVNSAGAVPRSA